MRPFLCSTVCSALAAGMVALAFFAVPAGAIDSRVFINWDDNTMGRINEVEQELIEKLEAQDPNSSAAQLFKEYVALLNAHQTLQKYLEETLVSAEKAASGEHPKGYAGSLLDVRNRLGNIYGEWLVRFDPHLERRLLQNLARIALDSEDAHEKYEAATCMGYIGNPEALPLLHHLRDDKDVRVREVAAEAIATIGEAALIPRSYEERRKFWEEFRIDLDADPDDGPGTEPK